MKILCGYLRNCEKGRSPLPVRVEENLHSTWSTERRRLVLRRLHYYRIRRSILRTDEQRTRENLGNKTPFGRRYSTSMYSSGYLSVWTHGSSTPTVVCRSFLGSTDGWRSSLEVSPSRRGKCGSLLTSRSVVEVPSELGTGGSVRRDPKGYVSLLLLFYK